MQSLYTILPKARVLDRLIDRVAFEQACAAIGELTRLGAAMVELMDRASLKAIEDSEDIDPEIKTLPAEASALLIEFQATGEAALHDAIIFGHANAAAEIKGNSQTSGYYSTTRTCELALTEATGFDYTSIRLLVDQGLL